MGLLMVGSLAAGLQGGRWADVDGNGANVREEDNSEERERLMSSSSSGRTTAVQKKLDAMDLIGTRRRRCVGKDDAPAMAIHGLGESAQGTG